MKMQRAGLWLALVVALATSCSSESAKPDGKIAGDAAGDRSTVDLFYRGDGACVPEGASAGCMSVQGTPAFKVCKYGRWTACIWLCQPGQTKSCTGGVQRCVDGDWGPCGA